MATETIFFGHDNKRDVTVASVLVPSARVKVGEDVQCPRCRSWTHFPGAAHGVLKSCVSGCGLRFGTLGTAIHMTDEQPVDLAEPGE